MSSIKQKTKQKTTDERRYVFIQTGKPFGNITSSYKNRNVIGNKNGRGDGKENQDPNRQQPIVPETNVSSPVGSTGSSSWRRNLWDEEWTISESSSVDFNRMDENQIQGWIDDVPSPPS